MEVKEQHSRTNYVVAIAAGLLLLALIGFIGFKVRNSLRSNSAVVDNMDTTNAVEEEHSIDTMAKPQKQTLDSAKFTSLFEQYFKKDTVPTVYPKFLTEAFFGYKFGDYLYLKELDFAALPETLETIEGNNKKAILELGHYYKGLAGMLIENMAMAEENLQWSIGHSSHEISTKAKWFLALTYIKMVQPEKAYRLLEAVASSNLVQYRNQAKLLLKELKAS